MRCSRVLALVLLVLAVVVTPGVADARVRVKWTKVSVREGDDARRVSRTLMKLLKRKSRRAKWGKRKKRIVLSAHVAKLEWQQVGEDVVRVSVTVVARIEGGRRARSFIRVGGRPTKRRKLERQALGIVASGLVTRLADMVRRGR